VTGPVVAIVQARMGASRLPNKMMLWLHGLPVIGWVWQRLRSARRLDRVVFALPDTPSDDVLADYLARAGADVFRGSETDVLGRYREAAQHAGAGTIVRVCADNPFVSASEVDRLVDFFAAGDFDYAYNHVPRGNTYPDGLGAEVTSRDLIETLHLDAVLPEHREHVFNFLWAHRERFRVGTCDPADAALAHPELRLDLDSPEDYRKLLRLDVQPGMTARAIVACALSLPLKEDR
jgi:spore coat polysaccharide biosynthesis protein SpsF